jgi:hypothetical protein
MMTTPNAITIARLEVVVMPNGEVICAGRSLGWVGQLGPYLTQAW